MDMLNYYLILIEPSFVFCLVPVPVVPLFSTEGLLKPLLHPFLVESYPVLVMPHF